ncbi:DUF4037 domain-containing protein [Demequina sp. B12]|uniref:DUF4037 domain-containing protein n=1 Tax=Demequina sp. B12 TaxID=2992757 RepID=UPI00237C38C5|nr:DUF4037 domain-containing protein [Demequina sp. B12]MDE0572382.1 DUF4037 domain-containing protein [Demequina sp. B12]
MRSHPHDGQFPVADFLQHLDRLFATQAGPEAAHAHLDQGIADATELGDKPALLTLHNEAAGFFRSISAHQESLQHADAALALISELDLGGTEADATTLINAATAQRAAGQTADARATYERALAVATGVFGGDDRRLAALHNNLSLALTDVGELDSAVAEQERALAILTQASVDPDHDLDIAMTHANMAHACDAAGDADAALTHSSRAVAIFRAAGASDDPHYAAALAAHASMQLRAGEAVDAVAHLQQARDIVERAYGRDSEAYRVTAANLIEATAIRDALGTDGHGAASRATAAEAATSTTPPSPASVAEPGNASAPRARRPHIPGLDLARGYWQDHGRPMIEERYPAYAGRIAAGLVGHGSECYGFDDEISTDHDFGVGFCLWLTTEDYMLIGADLQADYESLPLEYRGYPVRPALAARDQRRSGVFEIGDFFESITGQRHAPTPDEPHLWINLDEATLAAATNGEVFADPHGAFGAARGSFQRMPRDVWLTHLSRRAGLAAQTGQYNVPRMLDRGDGEAAWVSVGEFVGAASSLVFLLNRPAQVGYLPYYKWRFAALRELQSRPLARLGSVVDELTAVMRLASAACLGGAAFGEGGKGSSGAREALTDRIESICAAIADEFRIQGLSGSASTFLEHHRAELTVRIADAWLRQQ